jgi:hypothetical protein
MKRLPRVPERPAAPWRRRALAGLLLVAAASTWSQETPKPADQPAPAAAEKPTEPAAKTPAPTETPAASTTTPPATQETPAEGEKAPERFIPKEKASADNSATFPIDI